MDIIIDYNSDAIHIKDDSYNPRVIQFEKVKNLKMFQTILEEIFNRMDAERDVQLNGFDINLSKYDEDNHISIGEW